jgi:integrase/recombinase XerC
LEAYRRDLGQFLQFAQEQFAIPADQPGLVRHGHVRSWMVSLMDQGVKERSIGRKLSCLKTYWHFLLREGQRPTAAGEPHRHSKAPVRPAEILPYGQGAERVHCG